MILKQEDILFIKNTFQNMKSKKDLLSLLNFVKPLIYGKNSESFGLHHLNYHANSHFSNRYYIFSIKKKSGTERIIHSPNDGLKAIQRCLNLIFQTIYDVNPAATGFIRGKSIVDNANIHSGSYYVYNIDLKDFFSSIDQARLWGRLQHPPFNLNKKKGKLEIANIISSLCCQKMEVERLSNEGEWEIVERNVLPQGAPTSPTMINIICQQLDFYLSAVAKRFGLRYTRYADDITFSSMHDVYKQNGDFLNELHRIIKSQNFHIKESKTRLQKQGYRQEVTGLKVNAKVNVKTKYVKQLRLWLYYWESYGYEKANSYFISQYREDKGHTKNSLTNIEQVIRGKLNFLKMVKGSDNGTYIKLKKRFDNLCPKEKFEFPIVEVNSHDVSHKPIETVSFLKYFKYDNIYSFKGLVHKPTDETDFDYLKLLKDSTKQFSEIIHGSNGKINLPKKLIDETQNFFRILSSSGLEYYLKTNNHPLDNNDVGSRIQDFKKNYRFGNERSESSILSDLIINVAKSRTFSNQNLNITYSFGERNNSELFNLNQIKFVPTVERFQSKANFFTWVPNVRIALSNVFDSILKHSNIEGSRDFTSIDKVIEIELKREMNGKNIQIELSILDKDSVFTGEINNVFLDFRREFLDILKGICDFKIQFSTIENHVYECRILPYAEKLEEVSHPLGGFKYIFTFYD